MRALRSPAWSGRNWCGKRAKIASSSTPRCSPAKSSRISWSDMLLIRPTNSADDMVSSSSGCSAMRAPVTCPCPHGPHGPPNLPARVTTAERRCPERRRVVPPAEARGSGLLRGARGRLLGRRLLRRRLASRRLLGGLSRGLLDRPAGPLVGEQLVAALGADLLRVVVLAQRRVGLAVGDVGPEPTVLDHHRLARHGVGAQLGQRRLGGRSPALLGLGVDRQGLLEGDLEELLLGLDRARVGALLQVGPVPAVLRRDLLAVLGGTDHPR